MGLRLFFSHVSQGITHSISAATHRIGNKTHGLAETGRDIWAALSSRGAMNGSQRHMDEFKLAAGGVMAVAGAIEVNPLTFSAGIIGATITLWEAERDLQQAGHKWRLEHR